MCLITAGCLHDTYVYMTLFGVLDMFVSFARTTVCVLHGPGAFMYVSMNSVLNVQKPCIYKEIITLHKLVDVLKGSFP